MTDMIKQIEDLTEDQAKAALQKMASGDIDPSTDLPLTEFEPKDVVAAYGNDNDDSGYEFNGDEYDIRLLEHFAEYLQWRGYLKDTAKHLAMLLEEMK